MGVEAGTDMETARAHVTAVATRLVEAFGRHDAAGYFAHFSQDATFIFYTVSRMLTSRAEYEEQWRTWEREDGFRVRACLSETGAVRMIGPDAAVFTHLVTTVVTMKGDEETLHERETIVFARRDGHWVAVHEHLSTWSPDSD